MRTLKLLIISFIFLANYGFSHDLWINVEDFTPKPGSSIWVSFGFGHYYLCPGSEFISKKEIGEIYMLDPSGKKIELKQLNDWGYKSVSLQKEGTYLVVATRKPKFFTKTTEGYKRGRSKKGLKNVISCTYSAKYAKAIINVGKGKGEIIFKPLGHKLEIVPLKDPADLKVGDYFPVKVLYNKKPLKTEIFATYAGFSSDKNVFAYATRTDQNGIGEIKIFKPGIWLIKTSYKAPYPDPKECDQYSFSSTLTFEVK